MIWPFKKKDIFCAPDGSKFSPAQPPSRETLKRAEMALGFSLPPPLVDLYLCFGNGGYGPNYGVIGIAGGHKDADGRLDLVARYKKQVALFSDEDDAPWPLGLLPVCNHGCGMYSCVSTKEKNFPVYLWTCDEFPAELKDGKFEGQEIKLEAKSFESWVSSWPDSQKPTHYSSN